MSGSQKPAAAARDQLRAARGDREQVIEALKNAFVQGCLTRDEPGLEPMFLTMAVAAVFAAGLFLVAGVTNSVEQRCSRRPAPPPRR
jgi:hypothetical protein